MAEPESGPVRINPLVRAIGAIVALPRAFVEEIGQLALLAWSSLLWMFRPPYRFGLVIASMEFVGFQSIFIIALTGWFSGAVLALQSVYGFRQFGAEGMVGGVVALTLTRELSPVFAALMLTSRAGSAIATELGTMRVTDQIDALSTMAVNPVQYLVVPRVLAGVLMMPVLCMLFTGAGLLGAYMIGVGTLGIDPGVFMDRLRWYVDASDLFGGLFKAAVFGYVVTLIACRQGFYARGGAAGVGIAVTRAVVIGSVSILVLDYILTSIITDV